MKVARRSASRGTEKVTISLRPSDLAVVRNLAARRHRGNLSGAFAELIARATRLDAMDRVLEELPAASAEGLARLEAELTAPLAPAGAERRKKARRKRAA
jgi:hypothetical protein